MRLCLRRIAIVRREVKQLAAIAAERAAEAKTGPAAPSYRPLTESETATIVGAELLEHKRKPGKCVVCGTKLTSQVRSTARYCSDAPGGAKEDHGARPGQNKPGAVRGPAAYWNHC
jgi:hypothetical protein